MERLLIALSFAARVGTSQATDGVARGWRTMIAIFPYETAWLT
jgi:hypothetical protein